MVWKINCYTSFCPAEIPSLELLNTVYEFCWEPDGINCGGSCAIRAGDGFGRCEWLAAVDWNFTKNISPFLGVNFTNILSFYKPLKRLPNSLLSIPEWFPIFGGDSILLDPGDNQLEFSNESSFKDKTPGIILPLVVCKIEAKF